MAHLFILCEGSTERKVLEAFLRPYWQERFESASVRKFEGNGELKRDFKDFTERELRTEPDASVLCLVDLSREPFDVYNPERMTVAEGYEAVQRHMQKQIKREFQHRFGAFPVVMEIETWLLGDKDIQHVMETNEAEPETIPYPSRFLERHYKSRNRTFGKTTTGVNLFRRASAVRVHEDNCPHFNLLVDWLTKTPMPPPDPQSEVVKSNLDTWEAERDAKYQHYLTLAENPTTEIELDAAIQAQEDCEQFFDTYSEIFQDTPDE